MPYHLISSDLIYSELSVL